MGRSGPVLTTGMPRKSNRDRKEFISLARIQRRGRLATRVNTLLSEITARQKEIFSAFNIKNFSDPSYKSTEF
jgi:hypothetical protein